MRIPGLIILILFFCTDSFAQRKIDFGELPSMDSVPCSYVIRWTDHGVIPIIKSKNLLEIRVHVATGLSPSYIIILSFDEKKWELLKVTPAKDSLSKAIYDTLNNIPQNILEQNFDSLKKNKIFSLPGFYCLNLEGSVDDGIWGNIEIKAGDFYRKYDYNNPCYYMGMNKNIVVLEYLCHIVDLFEKMINANKPQKGKPKHN